MLGHDLSPTVEWTCDVCGERISRPEDGWVEWLGKTATTSQSPPNLRLVHAWKSSPRNSADRCQRPGASGLNDLPLPHFLGADGLMRLLNLLDEGYLPKTEVIEMIQRLHIPGYEQARPHFETAAAAGVVHPRMRPGFFFQEQIQVVLDHYRQHE